MLQVKKATETEIAVVLNEEHGVTADYDISNDAQQRFHATIRLRDGRTVRLFVGRGDQSRAVESIVILELHEKGKDTGPEIFRKWLTCPDAIEGNS